MAAAAQSNRAPRDVVEFPPNVPVTVALKYAQGRTISGQYGERFMFTLADNRVMFLDPEVAGQIATLGVNVRENFSITLRWDGQRESPRTWEVARVCGEQPNGTFVAPASPSTAAPSSGAAGVSPKPPASAATASGASSALVTEANALVDAYAVVLDRALRQYEGRIKPDEIRSIVLSAYIQKSKFAA